MLTKLEAASPWGIAVFRVVVGFLLFCHGASTIVGWPTAPYGGATAAFGAWPSWWAGVIQLVAGVALIVGFGTRIAAFIASGAMAVAYFWKHQPDGMLPITNDGDSAALFAWSLLLLVFVGSGRLAVDAVLRRRRSSQVSERAVEAATSVSV